MTPGQRGTARNGQHGIITEVYVNAVRFLSDTGAHFTLLNIEFTPARATVAEKRKIRVAQKKFFGPHGGGFHFGYTRRKGHTVKAFLRSMPGYLGIPIDDPEPEPE